MLSEFVFIETTKCLEGFLDSDIVFSKSSIVLIVKMFVILLVCKMKSYLSIYLSTKVSQKFVSTKQWWQKVYSLNKYISCKLSALQYFENFAQSITWLAASKDFEFYVPSYFVDSILRKWFEVICQDLFAWIGDNHRLCYNVSSNYLQSPGILILLRLFSRLCIKRCFFCTCCTCC